MAQFQRALVRLNHCGAGLHPVSCVHVGDAIKIPDRSFVDVTAKNDLDILTLGVMNHGFFELGYETHRALHPVLAPLGE